MDAVNFYIKSDDRSDDGVGSLRVLAVSEGWAGLPIDITNDVELRALISASDVAGIEAGTHWYHEIHVPLGGAATPAQARWQIQRMWKHDSPVFMEMLERVTPGRGLVGDTFSVTAEDLDAPTPTRPRRRN